MPSVVFFATRTGRCPAFDFLLELPKPARAKAIVLISHLAKVGHKIGRPHADILEDQIYELRWKSNNRHHRILYFFHDRDIVVLSHGLVKKQKKVPPEDLERAKRNREIFQGDPRRHTYVREVRL